MKLQRTSGILAHVTSLPSPFGIGDVGSSALNFLNFLEQSEQSCWQILPTVPTCEHFNHSPYMSSSAFAGNSLLISPESLRDDGFIYDEDLNDHPSFSPFFVEFEKACQFKEKLIAVAAANFQRTDSSCRKYAADFERFIKTTKWLRDYALFMTAKEVFNQTVWSEWPLDIAGRNKKALDAFEAEYRDRITYYNVEQFLFSMQWKRLKEKAEEKGIQLFGDVPIYVSYDSVDVWVNPNIFFLDKKTFKPLSVAGVPPDYFSKTGQRWGNPLYDWQSKSPAIRKKIYDWWAARLAHTFEMVHISRIDHFRGFESYWAVPENAETAETGEWLSGPGIRFFDAMKKRLGNINIVAEDLGIITSKVEELRDRTGFPGMKVLLFAFDGNPDNAFLPQNYDTPNCIVYTGTHDNSTAVGWYFEEDRTDEERRQMKSYVNGSLGDSHQVHRDLIYLAHSSTAFLSIIPLQDVLGFGNDCRMNTPGTTEGNWKWQCSSEYLTGEVSTFLRETTLRFNRGRKIPETPLPQKK